MLGLFKHSNPSVFASISGRVGSIGDNKMGGWHGYRASKAALHMIMKGFFFFFFSPVLFLMRSKN